VGCRPRCRPTIGAVKRTSALAPLSRDHHHGLFVAQQMRRATDESAPEARSAFLAFWESEGRTHFRVEEEVLLPAFARHGPADHPAIVQLLVDHVEIRRRADDLRAERGEPLVELVHDIGDRLHRHIRHEERVVFPLIEEAVPEPELSDLAAGVQQAERSQ
jgi:iron-sulfur cluster repair protein YtfE (RIC family)